MRTAKVDPLRHYFVFGLIEPPRRAQIFLVLAAETSNSSKSAKYIYADDGATMQNMQKYIFRVIM
jgi:hypothetical protein